MIMTHLFPCILFVLMCRTSNAGFTATLPLNTNAILPGTIVNYNTLICNVGNWYSGGIFTVPETGTYSVSVSMMSGTVTAHTTLRKAGPPPIMSNEIIVWLYTGNQYDMASQTINCELTKGQTLWVQMQSGFSLFSVYNTFTAVRIS